MGNTFSIRSQQEHEHAPTLDRIVGYYITTLDYQSLRNLFLPEYCDKLTELISSILEKKYSNDELTSLLETKGQEFDKQQVCNKLASFYVKVAHLFAAIITTINPEYVYTDIFGNTVKKNLHQKSDIPENVTPEISKLNLCKKQLDDLEEMVESEQPPLCSVNVSGINETGIPELTELYYDDGYDFTTGKFKDMTENTRKKFVTDLTQFYTTFTGNTDMPETITGFNEIKLKDYNRGVSDIVDTDDDAATILFKEYAENTKHMLHKINNTHKSLLEILDKLFEIEGNAATNIRVCSTLTDQELHQLIIESRNIIVSSYLMCESDFVKGVELYEAIVEHLILHTTVNQINTLNNKIIPGLFDISEIREVSSKI